MDAGMDKYRNIGICLVEKGVGSSSSKEFYSLDSYMGYLPYMAKPGEY
jgi:hypothetical protein